jgi:hypothetical protein
MGPCHKRVLDVAVPVECFCGALTSASCSKSQLAQAAIPCETIRVNIEFAISGKQIKVWTF